MSVLAWRWPEIEELRRLLPPMENGMFRRSKKIDTETMDAALGEVIAMLPADRPRTTQTGLLVEVAAGLLIDMRARDVTKWPTDRFNLLLNVLDRLVVQQ